MPCWGSWMCLFHISTYKICVSTISLLATWNFCIPFWKMGVVSLWSHENWYLNKLGSHLTIAEIVEIEDFANLSWSAGSKALRWWHSKVSNYLTTRMTPPPKTCRSCIFGGLWGEGGICFSCLSLGSSAISPFFF